MPPAEVLSTAIVNRPALIHSLFEPAETQQEMRLIAQDHPTITLVDAKMPLVDGLRLFREPQCLLKVAFEVIGMTQVVPANREPDVVGFIERLRDFEDSFRDFDLRGLVHG